MKATGTLFLGLLLGLAAFLGGQGRGAGLHQRLEERRGSQTRELGETLRLAGLQCSVWRPTGPGGPAPLVIFSHGFHGNRNQSTFLTAGLAHAGYLVIACDHKDAVEKGGGGGFSPPEVPFGKPEEWNETTYQDRAKDIGSLLSALKANERLSAAIDWSRLGLAGHSLGGYTVLGLAGAWPHWKLVGVKAVLALSPVANAYMHHGDLANLGCPVMYQTGTLDLGIAPFLLRHEGVYDHTRSPAYLIEFQGAGHLAWTDLNPRFQASILDYSLAFLNRYLKGDRSADPGQRRIGVADLRFK